ncbi:MAG TPA: potassium channel family protein [Candidatus Acidoferrales bacterium]|nr:potassium channel family protein [Candidatus Acidoferrales bacterium]
MGSPSEDRSSLLLFLSLLLYIVLSAFLADDSIAEGVLLLSLYGTLLASIFYLSTNERLRWPGILLAVMNGCATLVVLFHRSRLMGIAFWFLLACFLAFVCVGLFNHLGRPGAITRGRLYVSVSLYFLIGFFWFALYSLLETAQPGSFTQSGQPGSAHVPPRTLLYFSLETLTTLGYGDIVPLAPKARTLAVLEAAAGILYIAVTVARLVAGYQRQEE